MGERFKLELLDAIPEGEPVTLYHQGDWFDLCRGPHGPSTGRIGAFKLTKVAGAYWRGDASNPQLQRIYGTAFADQAELDAYLHQLEEAERRDHRRSAARWTCSTSRRRRRARCSGTRTAGRCGGRSRTISAGGSTAPATVEVKTPQLFDQVLWERSGHWDKFGSNMFFARGREAHLALKPMNCPGHVQIFNQHLHSYRDLPLRHGRVRLLPSQRAVGRAARHHAGARVHPGRRAHLLHARADHGRERRVLRPADAASTRISASTTCG